jgi:exopolyphosphatase/guanosine-5'-triphosphate,3'-diphosphate pyrophosphatase
MQTVSESTTRIRSKVTRLLSSMENVNPSRRCAFFDIGTNTILCLIAECGSAGDFVVLDDLAEIARLGQGVDQSGKIGRAGEKRSSSILRSFLERCASLNVQEITAVGTSALRDAQNSTEVRERWRRELGIAVRVISGAEEAAYSFLAACGGLSLADRELLVIDIGGGSTEFIRGNAAGVSQAVSVDVGTVRLTERYLHSDPVTPDECRVMASAIERALTVLDTHRLEADPGLAMIGIAATFTTMVAVEKNLAQYSHNEVHGSELSLDEVRRQIRLYQTMTIAERKTVRGLHPMRADVILAGAYLVEKIMMRFGTRGIIVSDQGVRYGLLYERLARQKSIDIVR